MALDLLLYGDRGIHDWNHGLHFHPRIFKVYLQCSFRRVRYRDTLL